MEKRKSYIFYVWEDKSSLFLKDAAYQIQAARNAPCIKKTYVDKSQQPLMERPEFQKVWEELKTGKYHLVIYDMMVLGKESFPILKVIDKLGRRNIDIVEIYQNLTTVCRDPITYRIPDTDAVQNLQVKNWLNENVHQNLVNSFIVLTGNNDDRKGYRNFRQTIQYPQAVIPLLNDDLWIQVVRVGTMELVYEFSCIDSLKQNKNKIYQDVRNLFIESYGPTGTGIYTLDKKYPLYYGRV